jgi:hypothetical protein
MVNERNAGTGGLNNHRLIFSGAIQRIECRVPGEALFRRRVLPDTSDTRARGF